MASIKHNHRGVTLEWYGLELSTSLRKEMQKRLRKAGGVVQRKMRQLVGRRGGFSTRVGGDKRDEKGRFKARRYSSRKLRSGEYDPPFKDTGRFYRSIRVKTRINKRSKMVGVQVGTNDPKAHLLEYGTKRMRARPSWDRAIGESRGEVLAILAQPFAAGELKLPV